MNVFTGMWDWFVDVAFPFFIKLFDNFLNDILKKLFPFFGFFKFLSILVIGIIGATLWSLSYLNNAMANIRLADIKGPSGEMLSHYTFMNNFLPLGEAFAGAILCFNVWFIRTAFRWVKSFIPTLSN